MTAIAFKNGIMSADTAEWSAEGIIVGYAKKIVRLPDGSLFAGAGMLDIIEAYIRWASKEDERPEKVEKEEDFIGLRAFPETGKVSFVSNLTFEYVGSYDVAAIGAHPDFLLGAMFAGLSAEEAVRLCIEKCADAAGEVQVERVNAA